MSKLEEIKKEYHEDMGLSFDSAEWLIEQVERWEKAYFYFKEDLEKYSYTDHLKCTDVIELDELRDLTSLMDELWREKMESLNKGDVE